MKHDLNSSVVVVPTVSHVDRNKSPSVQSLKQDVQPCNSIVLSVRERLSISPEVFYRPPRSQVELNASASAIIAHSVNPP